MIRPFLYINDLAVTNYLQEKKTRTNKQTTNKT